MNSTMMVSNLIILSTTMNGGSGLFPHAWALMIWLVVTTAVLMVICWPWTDLLCQIDHYPITENQRRRNVVLRRKIYKLVSIWIVLSIASAVIPLMCGL